MREVSKLVARKVKGKSGKGGNSPTASSGQLENGDNEGADNC